MWIGMIGLLIGYAGAMVSILGVPSSPAIKGVLAGVCTLFFGFFVLMMSGVRTWMGGGARTALLASGEAARAKILELKETGITVNKQPVADIVMEVRPEGRAPYQATVRQVIGRLQLGDFHTGTELWVRFDPTDPRRVAIGGGPPETQDT